MAQSKGADAACPHFWTFTFVEMQSRVAAFVVACAVGSACALNVRTAPDVEAHVKEEMQQNIQVHDTFQSQEDDDVREEGLLKASTDMSALQTHAHAAVPAEMERRSANRRGEW